jgi:hypothetical protein
LEIVLDWIAQKHCRNLKGFPAGIGRARSYRGQYTVAAKYTGRLYTESAVGLAFRPANNKFSDGIVFRGGADLIPWKYGVEFISSSSVTRLASVIGRPPKNKVGFRAKSF